MPSQPGIGALRGPPPHPHPPLEVLTPSPKLLPVKMDNAWRAYREGTVGEMQGLWDIITLCDGLGKRPSDGDTSAAFAGNESSNSAPRRVHTLLGSSDVAVHAPAGSLVSRAVRYVRCTIQVCPQTAPCWAPLNTLAEHTKCRLLAPACCVSVQAGPAGTGTHL